MMSGPLGQGQELKPHPWGATETFQQGKTGFDLRFLEECCTVLVDKRLGQGRGRSRRSREIGRRLSLPPRMR